MASLHRFVRPVLFLSTALLVALIVLVLAPTVASQALPGPQKTYPAAEGFLGFVVNNNSYGADRHNSPGFQVNLGYNVHRNIRLLGDFSWQYHDSNVYWNNKEAKLHYYQFLLGPEFVLRNKSRSTPFMHALAGFANRRYAIPSGEWVWDPFLQILTQKESTMASEWGFAAGAGGGLDVRFGDKVVWRLFEVDYLPTHLSSDKPRFIPTQGVMPVVSGWQHNYRFSTGVVFQIGRTDSGR
jgi:hypothetical protein